MQEILRTQYLSELDSWRDNPDLVKVILGARRSGKSVIMEQFVKKIISSGVNKKDVVYINFESSDYDDISNYRDLNQYIAGKIRKGKRTYVFLDEVQKVKGWEHTVNSLMADYDADVYITGSNAYLLSSELSTYISGRYVEIPVFPFSFKEFLEGHPPTHDTDRNARFQQYLSIGGIPLTDPDRMTDIIR